MHSIFLGTDLIIAAAAVVLVAANRGRAAERAGGPHGRRVRRERGGVRAQPLSVAARRHAGAVACDLERVGIVGATNSAAEFKAQTDRDRSVGTR